jgi:hypothetical protein
VNNFAANGQRTVIGLTFGFHFIIGSVRLPAPAGQVC